MINIEEKCMYCGKELYEIWASNPPLEGEFECLHCKIHYYVKMSKIEERDKK